jgi:hypothetical protein
MPKSKAFIRVPVVASILSFSTAAFANSNVPQTYEQAPAQPVHRQPVGYHDRTSADTRHAMDFQAVLARVEAQRQAFNNYGGVTSSSSFAQPDDVVSDISVDFSTATASWRYDTTLSAR